MSKAETQKPVRSISQTNENDSFDLGNFFPYQVRVFYRAVSNAIADVYSNRFNLTVSEWRTMVVLGPTGVMSASEIVERSSMDKVNVSRAIKGLQKQKFLKRDIDGDDKRRVVLRLTSSGCEMFKTLIPLVRQAEEKCLNGLSRQEQETLLSLMERVRSNVQ